MILGVNGIRLVGKRSGVARCIEAVLQCMSTSCHPFDEFRVYSPAPIASEVVLPACAHNVVLPSRLHPAAWEQVTLLNAHGDRDLLFCPSYVIPFWARCPTFLIHHGSYEGFPQAFSWWTLNKARMAYSMSARRASVVCTVSEYSKKDMVHFYGMTPERIHVVPEGVHTDLFRPIPDRDQVNAVRRRLLGFDEPFLLYVGKPTERRNLSPLVRAFASLKREQNLPHKLLIVGAELPGRSPFRTVAAELGVADEVVVVGYASHQDMPLIYNAADVFLYLSSYEGFGMPVLEAMACGTPVITMNSTAFPEFAGDVALLLPDAGVTTIKEGIRSILENQDLRRRMAIEGPRRAVRYDWRVVTREYLDLMLPLVASRAAA